jgi:hypothetical protein
VSWSVRLTTNGKIAGGSRREVQMRGVWLVLVLSVVLLVVPAGAAAQKPVAPAAPDSAAPVPTGAAGWQANPHVVQQASARQPRFNFAETRVPPYTLPGVLVNGGMTVRTPEEWRRRRAEILELFREHVYGRSPGPPERLRFQVVEKNPRAMDGGATLERIAVLSKHGGREHRFELTLLLPNAWRGRVPVFLLLNHRAAGLTDPTRHEPSEFWPAAPVLARGYGIAALQTAELAPDDSVRFRDGVIRLFEGTGSGPRPPNAWGALAAWAWGASRAMDYFATHARVDASRVAVVGHSRGGKAALWAGVEDERFALVIANESGEGGAALSRRQFGETVASLTGAFPHWFAENFRAFGGREAALPTDQHMLLALVAPRALYVASADEDLWADPHGEFLSQVHASPVYALWGDPPIGVDDMPPLDQPLVVGRRAYHVRTGGHDLTLDDWERFVDFADTLWRK